MDNGASLSATGLSRSASSPQAVSPVPASIPSAAKWALFYDDHPDTERMSVEYDVTNKYFPNCARVIWNGNSDNTVFAEPEEARWVAARLLEAAQAIETRRAETGTGSVADESAVPTGCANTTPEVPHG